MKRQNLLFLVMIAVTFLCIFLTACDVRNHQGTKTWPDGTGYVGEFRGDRPNGRGTYTYPDGSKYVGEFKNGQYDGHGTFTSPAGIDEDGEFRNGKPYRVSGTNSPSDGTIRVGTSRFDGAKSGGIIRWADGREYRGDWKLDEDSAELPDGTGTMTWPDGRQYVGQFRDGQMAGTGKMTYPDGKILDGSWEQNSFMGAAP
jgi:hypothetical protein